MIRLAWFTLCLLVPSVVRAESLAYALIVTNNRSQSSERPDLHYADDDGVQYAALFGELVGPDHVQLLTTLDAETAALHPNVRAVAPTRANLDHAVQQLALQLTAANAAGHSSVVYLALAGHGDIERGQGFIDLADGRLTAQALDEAVIAKLQADRVHLLLDSCNAYFLLSPRKPGGKRWQSNQDAPRDLLAKYPRLGAIVSTSAEAVTYEWSELQSGIFSYEVRAGLRGGADVDGDQRITYAELSAFISVANRTLTNDLYRPKVFARSPRADSSGSHAVLAAWPERAARRLLLDERAARRLTLRDARGVRLLDLHKEAGTALHLHLPPDEALYASELVRDADRPSWIERDIPPAESLITALAARPSAHAMRGTAPVFDLLFAEPFGKQTFARAQLEAQKPEEPPSDVTARDVERLRLHLSLLTGSAREARITSGMGLLILGAIPAATLSISLFQNSDRSSGWIDRTGFAGGVGIGIYSLVLGAYFLAVPWSEERLQAELWTFDYATERARARNLPNAERAFRDKARASRTARDVAGWVEVVGGAVTAIAGGVVIGEDLARAERARMLGPLNLAIGLGQLLLGVYLLATPSSLEALWSTYSHDPAVIQRAGP